MAAPIRLFLVGAVIGAIISGGTVFGISLFSQSSVLDCSDQFGCTPVDLNATIEPMSCRWDIAGFGNFVAGELPDAERSVCGGNGYVTEECQYSLYSLSTMLGCEMTPQGASNVTFVADPANYVTTPKTSATYTVTVVSSGNLTDPWDMAFLSDGTLIITEKNGDLNAVIDGELRTIAHIPTEAKEGTGLHGIAIDPAFADNQAIYVLYTYEVGEQVWNRVSRFRLEQQDGWALTDETVLVDAIRGSGWHNGGRLKFGPDAKLYVTTGDANIYKLNENTPQDKSVIEGKVLRLNRNGSVPKDNPFDSYVYTLGHRNPQGLAWHPVTDQLYIAEHGPLRHDEINRVQEPGTNFGWGVYKCGEWMENDNVPLADPWGGEYTPPVRCFDEYTLAPSGIVFVDDKTHPWYSDLFIAGLRGKHLHRLINGTQTEDVFYIPDEESVPNRLRDVEFHAGSLWILGDSTGLVQLTPS